MMKIMIMILLLLLIVIMITMTSKGVIRTCLQSTHCAVNFISFTETIDRLTRGREDTGVPPPPPPPPKKKKPFDDDFSLF